MMRPSIGMVALPGLIDTPAHADHSIMGMHPGLPIGLRPALTVTLPSVDFGALMHPTFHDHPLRPAQLRGCAFARGNGIQDSVRARPVGYPILDRREGKTA
jgi:hypothetical protein